MESNGNQNMPPATLCRAGCGFYANAAFEGLCSKCYKDALKRKQTSSSPVSGRASPASCSQASSSSVSESSSSTVSGMVATATQTTTPSIETAMPTVPTVSTASQSETSKDAKDDDESLGGATAGAASDSSDSSNDKDKKPKKNRCFSCKKKVGLTGFQCRCGGLFCSLHRYSDKHDCQFNYREHGKELIKKQNPVVVGEKIQKI